jgi:hypothetical protein
VFTTWSKQFSRSKGSSTLSSTMRKQSFLSFYNLLTLQGLELTSFVSLLPLLLLPLLPSYLVHLLLLHFSSLRTISPSYLVPIQMYFEEITHVTRLPVLTTPSRSPLPLPLLLQTKLPGNSSFTSLYSSSLFSLMDKLEEVSRENCIHMQLLEREQKSRRGRCAQRRES